MKADDAERRLLELWGEIRDLQAIQDLLLWDQETYLPRGGIEARASQVATLAATKHRRLTAPELVEALEVCAAGAGENGLLAAQVRTARLDVDRAVRLPEALVRALAEARAKGLAAWEQAREERDFAVFSPHLERLLELRREEATTLVGDGGRSAYDALIHRYEPGMTEVELEPLFAQLVAALTPLVRAVADSGRKIDKTPAPEPFDAARQRRFALELIAAVGFDLERGRLDVTTHPFCVGLDRSDVRLTWRQRARDFRSAISGILHETGHGLYEQGLPAEHRREPVGTAISLGVHESQSRLWENHVGGSHGFCRWIWPRYRAAFPGAPEESAAEIWRRLHAVEPSLIRVRADEVTYNLHVAVRFELERRLFSGGLEVPELPAAWNDLYGELLGVRPEDDVEGVLQDIHWAQGMFGYFPTYTLGNLMAAQLFDAARRDLGDLDAAFEHGEFAALLAWLRERVHRHGGRYQAPELIARATGRPLGAGPLLEHLRRVTEEAYGLELAATPG